MKKIRYIASILFLVLSIAGVGIGGCKGILGNAQQEVSDTTESIISKADKLWEPKSEKLTTDEIIKNIDNIQENIPNVDFDVSDSSNTEAPSASFDYLNDNIPEFTEEEKQMTNAFETYSELDERGRVGVAFANICKDLMPDPDAEREELTWKPSGWSVQQFDFIDNGGYLYNRCHLIAYCLAGENDNKKNLMTGTRYFNTEGMLPWEIMVADYVDKTDNHVLYRVTPVFGPDCYVASGVQIEAYSVEDHGKGVCFNVFVYNIQPGVEIDYRGGVAKEA